MPHPPLLERGGRVHLSDLALTSAVRIHASGPEALLEASPAQGGVCDPLGGHRQRSHASGAAHLQIGEAVDQLTAYIGTRFVWKHVLTHCVRVEEEPKRPRPPEWDVHAGEFGAGNEGGEVVVGGGARGVDKHWPGGRLLDGGGAGLGGVGGEIDAGKVQFHAQELRGRVTLVTQQHSPWAALWSMMLGFFMILVDSTIVSVAIPAITADLGASYSSVIWVNSAYLLAYAVPLLITGRLGDRFGPRTIYLSGLALFTVSSLACGLAGTIEALILARVFQGLGGAMVTPQTMAVMIRTFHPTARGGAMGVWGATAGVATITGPLLGGVLVDASGWPWIFYVNVPVGILGLVLGWIFVPRLERTARTFDWVGVALSAVGMFCLIFGIQEANALDWDWRALTLIIGGLTLLAVFVAWQSRTRQDPLVPLALFHDRNFSLAAVTIATVGFTMSTYMIPWMIYIQSVQGFSPTRAALLLVPAGLVSGTLSPWIGKLTNTHQPKPFAIAGLSLLGASVALTAWITDPAISSYWLAAISVLNGVANSMVWGPLSMIATRNLAPALAGAGSSVYNTLRQIGAVIGSAAIAAVMSAQLDAQLGAGAGDAAVGPSTSGAMPEALHAPFALAMSHSLYLPAAIALLGAVLACRFARTKSWND